MPVPSRKPMHAVIDIGSNSVRLVVYHSLTRVPLPVFNEKYYCGLGKGLGTSGKLNPEGREQAIIALRRFKVMLKNLEVKHISVLATAAMRDAQDGPEFLDFIQKKIGFEVTLISGEREAELAAKGVLASIYHPQGICADLGGGSVELAHLKHDSIMAQASFEVGVLRLLDESGGDSAVMREMIAREFAGVSWLKTTGAKTIIAIGGSFRTIAKLYMREAKYPLPIVHEFTAHARQIDKLTERLATFAPDELEGLPAIPKKRAATLLPAALILQELLKETCAEQVCFSVSGIREGLLFEQLPEEVAAQDALLASAADLAALVGRKGAYARELFAWMQPLFPQEKERQARLRMALCQLSELAWTIDPNFRSEWAYARVIQSAIKGVNHRERVMLALALFHRYQTKWKQERGEILLLDERDRLWARTVGLAANLAFHLSGAKAGNLVHSRLEVEADALSLLLDKAANPLRTEMVEKRLEGLGSTFKALSSFLM